MLKVNQSNTCPALGESNLDSPMHATRHSQQLDLYRSLTRLGKGGSTLRMAGECGIAARKVQCKKASGSTEQT